MGVDFLKRINKSFHRSLDKNSVALRTPSLFDAKILGQNRTALGNIQKSANLRQGEKLIVREKNGRLVGQRSTDIVLEFQKPPADYVERVRQGGGIEQAEVVAVYSLAQTAEVSFCK